jgi:hypothetical protein
VAARPDVRGREYKPNGPRADALALGAGFAFFASEPL